MSLMKTLTRVAVGIAVAKGASALTRNARAGKSGTMLDDWMAPKGGTSASTGSGMGGGLGGLLDSLQGKQTGDRRTQPSSGGLQDMLGGLAGAGGLGGLLGGLAGGASGGGFGKALQSQFDTTPEPAQEPTADQEGLAAVMLLAMVQAAQADGHLDDTERGRIMDHLNGATPAERAFVEQAMAQRMSVTDLAARVPAGAEAQVYSMAVMAIDLDHPAEVDFLRGVADELGLRSGDVNDIHAQMGVVPLYS
ncbi:MAG: tellurite resistance TerB family protein [Alphaproteobacteria bacterium]|nr:tellurite resistance TerB family protein [Alphaproteobacteria bacterium]